MAKRRREIVEVNPAYTTRLCSAIINGAACGSTIDPSEDALLTCERGHTMDQDVNAARNLWSVLDEELRAVAVSLASVTRSQVSPHVVPVSSVILARKSAVEMSVQSVRL